MKQVKDRKVEERELHDELRGHLQDDAHYNSNKKFYSISHSNRSYVKDWLAKRCAGKKVLDYCCGNGDFAIWLAEAGADAYGIDISPVSIENAKGQALKRGVGEKVTFHVMDAEATTFDDNYFDFAVVNGILHHLDLSKAYKELARILNKSGGVICTEALRHNIFIHSYRKMTPHLRSEWEVDHILGKKDIELAKQYFTHVEVSKFFHLATIGAIPFRNMPIFTPVQKSLEIIDSILLKIPILKWQAWMAVFVLSFPKKLNTK